MNKCRCDERLQTKTKEFTRLPYTGLVLELEHLKIVWFYRTQNNFFFKSQGQTIVNAHRGGAHRHPSPTRDAYGHSVFFEWACTEIITEISKEVENNTVGRVNTYEKQHVPRRNGGVGGSYGGGGGVGRSRLDPTCV
jgi:hypothetical protein